MPWAWLAAWSSKQREGSGDLEADLGRIERWLYDEDTSLTSDMDLAALARCISLHGLAVYYVRRH